MTDDTYANVSLAAAGDGVVTILHTGDLGHLAILSAKDLSVTAERPLAICP